MTKKEESKYESLYNKAHEAGLKAGNNSNPTPMVVGEETSPFSGVIDDSKPTYFVEGGVCGFAWINIKPARGKFVSWLKKNKIGRTDSYYGGYTIWVHNFGQSMQRKVAYADAFSNILHEEGINAYSNSRID